MDIASEISSIKAKLGELERELQTATGDREREIAIRNSITATQNSLTEYVKLLSSMMGKNFAFKNWHQICIHSKIILF